MTIPRRWWEPELRYHRHDNEERDRHAFDLGDLLSLAMGGGEFAHLAELACCARCDRPPTVHFRPQ